ncbi:flagellar protein FlaG [Vallitalea guaymasensis]|uniref:flagellar protein FlaG n=1 Tax=Vallitalea guaymasensis TaxID=1185412 RepID=UPI000DE22F8F|nr:flagellar protein FlaG [Vallitalea guaymasensis]
MRIESNNINTYYNSNSQGDLGITEITYEAKKVNEQSKKGISDVSVGDTIINEQISEHEVIQAIEKANKQIKYYDRRLEFSIHEKTKQIMVKVINTEDNSIVREIPSEKILDMVAKLWEMAGIFVDEKR